MIVRHNIASNYYPFGSVMRTRNWSSSSYRYGFNGQEKDDEVSGDGNTNTAEYWEYDTRLGRRWNLDPIPQIKISDYSCFGNNPIWLTDHNGDDFVNVHTERKNEAKKDLDDASNKLDDAKEGFKKYESLSKNEIKDLKKSNKEEFKNYKNAKNELKAAKTNFRAATETYNQEVEFEAIVNEVLEDFRIVNPELYAEWNKFKPQGSKSVLDIEMSAQYGPIKMIDINGFATGGTTTEAIRARIGGKDPFVTIRLQVIMFNDIIQIQEMSEVTVHALGHIAPPKYDNDEKAADAYEKENYSNKVQKKK